MKYYCIFLHESLNKWTEWTKELLGLYSINPRDGDVTYRIGGRWISRDLQKEAEGLYQDVLDFSKEDERYLEENNRYTTQYKGVNIRFFDTEIYVWASLEQMLKESGLWMQMHRK